MENYICISLGKKLPSQITYPVGQPVQWVEYGHSGLTLYIGYPQMTDLEADLFSEGSYNVNLNELNNIAFFTFKFYDYNNPNKTIPYLEAPHHPNLEDTFDETLDFERELQSLRQNANIGDAFSIVAFDSLSGIVKGQRLASLSNKFSLVMLETMAKLNKTRMSKEEFISNVTSVQARYTTEDVYKMSKHQYRYFRK